MHPKTVVTSNVVRLVGALDQLQSRDSGEDGMALLAGRTGEGKTTAVHYVAGRAGAVRIRARVTWGLRSLLGELSEALGLERRHRTDDMVRALVEQLLADPRPVFVDEADYLFARPTMLDSLRDVYDESRVPVFLVGSDSLPPRLRSHAHHGRFTRRISRWISFDGLTAPDADKVLDELAECGIDEPLRAKMYRTSEGNVAAFTAGLCQIERFAATNGLEEVTAEAWGDRPLPSPTPRGFGTDEE